MKTSVVLSTYNGEKYIRAQLDSLKNQSQPIDEVLILDDSSSDATVDIISSYLKENQLNNWVLHQNKKNIGWRRNFICGIQKCSGDLIFTCDQDDIWSPYKIEKMRSVMENQKEIKLLVSSYIEFHDTPPAFTSNGDAKAVKMACPSNILDVSYPGCTYCFRRTFFEDCLPYWIETCPHDALLWRSAELLDCLYILNEPLILWRKHNTSAWQKETHTVSRRTELEWRSLEKIELENLMRFAQDQDISTDKIELIHQNLAWCITRSNFLAQKDLFTGIKLIKFLKQYHGVKQYIKDWIIAFGK